MVALKVLADKYGKNASDLKKKILQSKLVKQSDFGKVGRALALPKDKLDEIEKHLLKETDYLKKRPPTLFEGSELKVSPKKIQPRYTEKVVEKIVPVTIETEHFGDALSETATDIFGIMEVYDARMDVLRKENGYLKLQLNDALNETNQVHVNELIEFVSNKLEFQNELTSELLKEWINELLDEVSFLRNQVDSLSKFELDKDKIALVELQYKYKEKKLRSDLEKYYRKIINKTIQRFLGIINQHKSAKEKLLSDFNQKIEQETTKLKSEHDAIVVKLKDSLSASEKIISEIKSASQKEYLIMMSDIVEKLNSKNILFATLLFSVSSIEGYLTGFLLGDGNMAIARGIAITTVGFFLSVYHRIEKGIKNDREVRKLRLMSESEMLAYYRFGVEDLKRIEAGAVRKDILIRKREDAISELLSQKIYSDFFSVVNIFSIAITIFSVISMVSKFGVNGYMAIGVGFLILIFSKMSLHNIK